MDGTLFVHREFNGSYQLVGILEENAGFPIFTYSPKYLESGDAAPISISLPLTAETFSPDATGSFFSGIIPEGQLNRDLEKRVERNAEITLRYSIWSAMNPSAPWF